MLSEHSLSEQQLIPVLGLALKNKIKGLLAQQKSVALALAGGTTPAPLYRWLSEQADIAWGHCKITLTDERWVNPQQPDSNELLLRENLFINHGQQAYFCPLKNAEKSAREGQQSLEMELRTNLPQLDIVLLGMGDDGHFASVFPELENFEKLTDLQNTALCQAVQPPHAPHERMTLTPAYLLSAQHIFVLFKGAKKIRLYEQAKHNIHHIEEIPLRLLLSQKKVPVDVYWSD